MTDYTRVSDKETGHEYTVPAHLFNERAHKRLDNPAVDVRGQVIPAKYKVDLRQSQAPKAGPKAGEEKSDG